MIIPIYLAYVSFCKYENNILQRRLNSLLKFLKLENKEKFQVQYMIEEKCGLIYISTIETNFTIPLIKKNTNRMTISAYLPFGVTKYVDSESLNSGDYLPAMVDRMRHEPGMLTDFTPPQVWCDLFPDGQTLTLFNDYRGFGRIYEYTTSFGTIWSNKMAAALLFAGVPARRDDAAWADMTVTGKFSSPQTGYANMRYVAPGTLITVDTCSNMVERRRLSTDTGGVDMEPTPSHAVEETHAALIRWCHELRLFDTRKLRLQLSGGRDSRVIGAYLLAQYFNDLEIITCYPPNLDAEIATELVKLSNTPYSIVSVDRKNQITQDYGKTSLLELEYNTINNNNIDISITTLEPNEDISKYICSLGGCQGEVAHNNYYTHTMIKKEIEWLKNPQGKSPSAKRLESILNTMITKSWGTSPFARQQSYNNIKQNVISKAYSANLTGFYTIDFLYLDFYLNRQWAGATGIDDMKTPLTVYPYVRYGFSQTLESKVKSTFIRNIISKSMPLWDNIPFFHEFPEDARQDFYSAYPNMWDMNLGDEILEICLSDPNLWTYFDRIQVLETFMNLRNKEKNINEFDNRCMSVNNNLAKKIIRFVVSEDYLKKINSIIDNLNNNGVI